MSFLTFRLSWPAFRYPIEDADKNTYLDSNALFNARQINVEGDGVGSEAQRYTVQSADVLFANGLMDVKVVYVAVMERRGDVDSVYNLPYFSPW